MVWGESSRLNDSGGEKKKSSETERRIDSELSRVKTTPTDKSKKVERHTETDKKTDRTERRKEEGFERKCALRRGFPLFPTLVEK